MDPLDYISFTPEIGQPTWAELIVCRDGKLHRELDDPVRCVTAGDLVLAHGVRRGEAALYSRDWVTGVLTAISEDHVVYSGLTVVAVIGVVHRLFDKLNSLPQILPARMHWPV